MYSIYTPTRFLPARRIRQFASRPRRAAAKPVVRTERADGTIILGVDPGLACTGIGVISCTGSGIRRIHSEVVRSDASQTLASRLARISSAVRSSIERFKPDKAALERIFFNVNPASSMKLGHARGAALSVLGEAGLEPAEVAPRVVKQNLTGDSVADKRKMVKMVRALLAIPANERLAADAADALAIAIAHGSAPGALRLRRGRRL